MIQNIVKAIVLANVCADLLQETLHESNVDILKDNDDKDLIQQFLQFVIKKNNTVNPQDLWKMLHDKLVTELTKLCNMLPKIKEMEPVEDVKSTTKKPLDKARIASPSANPTWQSQHQNAWASVDPTFPLRSLTASQSKPTTWKQTGPKPKPKPKPKPHDDEDDEDEDNEDENGEDENEDENGDDEEDWQTIHDKIVCHLKCVCCLMCKLDKLKQPNGDDDSKKRKLSMEQQRGSIWRNVSPPKSDDDSRKIHEKLISEVRKMCCLMHKLEDMSSDDKKKLLSKKDKIRSRTLFSAAPYLTKQFEHHFHDEHHGEPEHHVESEHHDQARHIGGMVPEHHAEEEHHDEPEHHLEHEHHANGDEEKKDDPIKKQQPTITSNTTSSNTKNKKKAHKGKRF